MVSLKVDCLYIKDNWGIQKQVQLLYKNPWVKLTPTLPLPLQHNEIKLLKFKSHSSFGICVEILHLTSVLSLHLLILQYWCMDHKKTQLLHFCGRPESIVNYISSGSRNENWYVFYPESSHKSPFPLFYVELKLFFLAT